MESNKKWLIPLGALIIIGIIAVLTSRFVLNRQPHDTYNLYMVAIGDKGRGDRIKGCDDSLVAIRRETVSDTHISDIYQDVVGEKTYDAGEGLKNPLAASNLTYQSAIIDGDGVARIDLGGTVVSADACDSARIKAQLEKPAYQFDGVKSVVVQIDGKPLADFLKQ